MKIRIKFYIWKPISFWTHFAFPGTFLAFLIWCIPPVGIAALLVFMRYEKNEDHHMDTDKMYQDIQGVWVALIVCGVIISILGLCGVIPLCPMMEVI